MPSEAESELEQVRLMTRAVGLELSPDRLRTLLRTWSTFRQDFEPLWPLELGDREPATWIFDPIEEDR